MSRDSRPAASSVCVNSYKVKLALSIIDEHFGLITKDVAHAVMTIENATLFNVAKRCSELQGPSKLTSKQVSNTCQPLASIYLIGTKLFMNRPFCRHYLPLLPIRSVKLY